MAADLNNLASLLKLQGKVGGQGGHKKRYNIVIVNTTSVRGGRVWGGHLVGGV